MKNEELTDRINTEDDELREFYVDLGKKIVKGGKEIVEDVRRYAGELSEAFMQGKKFSVLVPQRRADYMIKIICKPFLIREVLMFLYGAGLWSNTDNFLEMYKGVKEVFKNRK